MTTPVFLLGAQRDTSELFETIECPKLADRPWSWTFSGQVNHEFREALVQTVEGRNDGELHVSGGFSQGMPRPEYLRSLARAKIALCPGGHHTPDTFRLYEAIEAGCLPICDRRSPAAAWGGNDNYWHHVLGQEPFPCVNAWKHDLPKLLEVLLENPQHRANLAGAWWLDYKRGLAHALLDSANVPETQDVTVLMPTSPIPSHPSTEMIEDAIRRVRRYLPNSTIMIMVDGVRPEQEHRRSDYVEYTRRLIELCKRKLPGCLPIVFSEHRHQADMTKVALERVRTPFVFFVEHDTWPTGEIDIDGILQAMGQRSDINYVKLHIDDRILPEHQYLMRGEDVVGDVRLTRTIQWSQRPHFAKADWYRGILSAFFGSQARTMIEDVMWSVVYNRVTRGIDPWERYGLWIYTPPGGTLRSGHANGRGDDPKYNMKFSYDGDVPEGAPRS